MNTRPILSVTCREDAVHSAQISSLSGKLTGTAASYEFLDDARTRIDAGLVNVILDLEHVDRVDSTGVGILASLYNSAHAKNGKVVIVHIASRAHSVLSVMHLLEFIKTAESIDAALQLVQGNT